MKKNHGQGGNGGTLGQHGQDTRTSRTPPQVGNYHPTYSTPSHLQQPMNPPQGSPPSIPVNRFGSDPSVGQQGANKRGRNQSQNSDMGGDRDRRRLGELSSTQPSNVAAMAAAVAAAASAAAGGAPQSPAGTGVGQGQNQGQGQHQNNSSSNWPFAIPSLPLNPGFPNSPQQQQQQQSQQQQAAAAAAAAQQQQQQQQNYAFAAAFANVIASRSDPMLPFPGPPRTAQTPSTASSSGTNSQQQQSHQAPSTTTDSDLLGKPQRGIGAAPALMDLVGRLRNILQSYRGESSADEARRTIVDFREAADSTSDTASSAAGFAPDSTGADRNWDGGVFEFLLQHTGALDFLQSQGSRDGLQRIVDRMDALFAPTDTLVTDPTGAVDLTTAWDPEMDTASSMGWSAGDNNAGGAPISGGTATAAAMAAAVAAASANPAARMQMQAQLQFMQMQQQQQQQQSNYGQHPGGGPMASSLAPSLRSGPMGPVPSHLGPAHQRMASGGSVPGNPGFPTFRHPSQPAQQQQQQQGGGQQGGQGQMTSPQTQVPMHQRSQFPHPQGQQALPHPRYPTQQQQGQQQQQQQQQGQQQGQQQFLHSPSAPQSAQQQYGNHLINALRSASQGQAASVNPQMLTGEGTFSPSQNPGGPGILFESPNSNASSNMDPNALHGQNTQGFFPRTLAGSSNASSQSGSNNSRSENTKGSSAQRTGSGSGSGSGSDPTTLNNAPGVLPPSSNKLREPLSATLTEESIHALTTVLKAVGPNVPGGMQARQYQPLVNALSQLSVRLRSTGDDYFLEPLLGQVGWDEGISAKDFVEYWASMCSSLREQQREQKASKVPARQSKGKQKEDAMSVESGDEEEETERGRSRGVEEESGRVTRQAKSAGGTGTQSGDSKKQQGGVKQDPAEAALQESSFGLLALALSLMPRAEDDKKEDGKRRSGNSSAAQGGDEWKTKVNDFVASAPSRSDPVFQGMLANANNVLGANASIEAFIQHLAGFIGQRLPRAYRAVKKAVVSLWLFLRELKTNNAGLDARKVDNMIQGQLCYHAIRLQNHPLGCFDTAFKNFLMWHRYNVTETYFGIGEQADTEGSYVDTDRLYADLESFISYDPVGVEGGQGSDVSEMGEEDAVTGTNSIGDDRLPLELSVPKIEYINTVAEALLLVEYLRRQWIRYRALFADRLKWTNYCRLMGSSSSSENRFAKPLRRAAAVIHLSSEIQEIFRRPFAVDMKDLKDKLDKLEKQGTAIDAFSVERTLEAVERLKSWRIRTVSIVELMSKLSDFCECLRLGGGKISAERQLELLACFVSGLRTQIDPLQDSELYATFEDYVTRRFHFDPSAAAFDAGWTLGMFANALQYFVTILQNTGGSSPGDN